MELPRTPNLTATGGWGAAVGVGCTGVILHIVTSNEANWYLTYNPEETKTPKQVFISYIAPIHYNSVITMDERHMRPINHHTAYKTNSIP